MLVDTPSRFPYTRARTWGDILCAANPQFAGVKRVPHAEASDVRRLTANYGSTRVYRLVLSSASYPP
jgi:hypothetical protein